MKVFSIYDKKANKYAVPQFAEREIDIIRALQIGLTQQNESLYSQFPEDFDLYKLGEFDEDEAHFILEPPVHLLNLASLKK